MKHFKIYLGWNEGSLLVTELFARPLYALNFSSDIIYYSLLQTKSPWQTEELYFEANLMLWSCLILVATLNGIGSAYFAMLFVLGPLIIRDRTLQIFKGRNIRSMWIWLFVMLSLLGKKLQSTTFWNIFLFFSRKYSQKTIGMICQPFFYGGICMKTIKVFWSRDQPHQLKSFKDRYLYTKILMSPTATNAISFISSLSAGLGGSDALLTGGRGFDPPPRSATFFCGDWSWNIFYSHSLPSADARRAVVSFW